MIIAILKQGTKRVRRVVDWDGAFEDYPCNNEYVQVRTDNGIPMPEEGWLWNGITFLDDLDEPLEISTDITREEWIMRFSPAEWGMLKRIANGQSGVSKSVSQQVDQLLDVILHSDSISLTSTYITQLMDLITEWGMISGTRKGDLAKPKVVNDPAAHRRRARGNGRGNGGNNGNNGNGGKGGNGGGNGGGKGGKGGNGGKGGGKPNR